VEVKANQAGTDAKMDVHQDKMDAWIAEMRAWQKGGRPAKE
jgi:hypothetical protein